MIAIMGLWLPILLSAVVVFVASSILHMLLPWHRSDYRALPNESAILDALRAADAPPGDYLFPYSGSTAEMRSEAMQEKYRRGPVGLLTVMPSGPPAMGKNLAQWFVFCVVVGVFVAYLTGRTLDAGTHYLAVFRVAGTSAFLAHAAARATDSIWMGRPWSSTAKHIVDGLIYGLLTAGIFGWLWPA